MTVHKRESNFTATSTAASAVGGGEVVMHSGAGVTRVVGGVVSDRATPATPATPGRGGGDVAPRPSTDAAYGRALGTPTAGRNGRAVGSGASLIQRRVPTRYDPL